ncbi:hypothetical protein SAMN05444358_11450 [Ruegeria halocynthiae]|uniref:Uncharacterized protein n=1 Tax=Ruegeria halocynthiae TaxID=985054 RepID=A0A1H3FF60_9RHOB|nr:hypothetical protein [Ruegeria halocynthiae]SDX89028.1 hypothetical protein SAMN05444358_11450 [Ruegeria halocynthiae]
MMKKILVLGAALMLAACEDAPQSDPPETGAAPAPTNDNLPLVRGYRSEDDWCQLTGESSFTGEFLDHAADLVSCPTGSDAEQSLVESHNAQLMGQTGGYTVYSIPLG